MKEKQDSNNLNENEEEKMYRRLLGPDAKK